MIIRSSEVALSSSHRHQVEHTRTERLRVWADRPARALPTGPGSEGGTEPSGAACPDAPPLHGRLRLLVELIERFTGHEVHVMDAADLAPPSADGARPADPPRQAPPGSGGRAGWGLEYEAEQTRVEREETRFAAAGAVRTADGREITFAAATALARESVEVTRVRLAAGDPARPLTDPLVLTDPGRAPALSGQQVDLDLDADGTSERVAFVAEGSAYLVLDRNGNGRVDDGTELFGPTSGDGFAELAEHDADGNGWIDEADPVFARLRLWDDAGGPLASLADRGVGAIGLDRVSTPFDLTSGSVLQGAVRSSGVWLAEDGAAGTMHQIDLAT